MVCSGTDGGSCSLACAGGAAADTAIAAAEASVVAAAGHYTMMVTGVKKELTSSSSSSRKRTSIDLDLSDAESEGTLEPPDDAAAGAITLKVDDNDAANTMPDEELQDDPCPINQTLRNFIHNTRALPQASHSSDIPWSEVRTAADILRRRLPRASCQQEALKYVGNKARQASEKALPELLRQFKVRQVQECQQLGELAPPDFHSFHLPT